MASKMIRLIDRTRTVADWICPRSRYWGYEHEDRGLVKNGTSIELFIGIVIHDAMAAIASISQEGKEVPIDEIARAAFCEVHENILSTAQVVTTETKEYALEQGTLIEGMLRGFHKHVWPRLMNQYKIIAVEKEMEYNLDDNIIFMAKPDLIVEDAHGDLVYLEYKSTSSKKDNWVNSWETAVQLHSSILATEQTLGRRPAYVQIIGLYKGYESYGKQGSPFCYAYKRAGNPPFTKDQIDYEFRPGFKRTPTWEMEGGVKKWIENMPELVLANQYPLTPPIMVNEDLVNSFFKQRLIREREIATFSGPDDLDRIFPQHFDKCVPSFGWQCQFKKLCHSQVDDPLTEGFQPRQPHHARELEALDV